MAPESEETQTPAATRMGTRSLRPALHPAVPGRHCSSVLRFLCSVSVLLCRHHPSLLAFFFFFFGLC